MPNIVHGSWFIVRRSRKETTNHKPSTTNRKSKGFTLIEILVVLSIMAVLAGGLLYSTNNARDKGKDARRKDDLKAVSTALVAYYTDHNKYPPATLGDPLDYVSDAASPWIPPLATYLNKLPKDPLQAGLLAPLASIFENGKKIAGGSWSWLSTNQTTAQKPKGQVAGASDIKLGNEITTPGSNSDTNFYNGSKFTTGSVGGQAISMSIYSTIPAAPPNNKYQLVIYSDNAGVPGTLIAKTSGTDTLIANAWSTASLTTSPTLMPNTSYWLMLSTNGASTVTKSAGSGSYWFINPNSFGTPPNTTTTIPGANKGTEGGTYSIYVTYTPNNNIYSATVSSSADDGKRQSINGNPSIYESDILDNPTGTWIQCPDHSRSNYFRFSNVTIPPGTNNIVSAKITFTPRTDRPDDVLMNSTTLTTFQSKLRGELALDASQIPASVSPTYAPDTEFMKRVNSTPPYTVTNDANSVDWNNPSPWTGATADTPDITNIIQAIVSQPSWDATSRHINIFWIDYTPLTPCPGKGRIGISYEGQFAGMGAAPRLTITWTAGAPPTTCTDLTATNFGQPLPCTYSSGTPTTGACDSKTTNVYCLRTSANQKAFVLWAMLENLNDPQLFTNTTTALCNSADPDFTTNTSSPYFGLNIFTGSPGFNYCIKSPQ